MDNSKKLIGKKINCYIVDYADGMGSNRFGQVERKSQSQHEVVYENNDNFVIDNESLTTVGKLKGYGAVLNKPIVSLRVADEYWGNTLYFLLYTDEEYSNKDIAKIIKDNIKVKSNDILALDLSFITEG